MDAAHTPRPVWLVKVPRFVSAGWEAAAANSVDAEGALVGHVHLEVDPNDLKAPDGPEPEPTITLKLDNAAAAGAGAGGEAAAATCPDDFVLARQGDASDENNFRVFCQRRDPKGSTSMSCEGTVTHRFDAKPRADETTDALNIDERYRELSRKRKLDAETKVRQIEVISTKDAIRSRGTLLPTNIGFGATTASERKEAKVAAVKVRMERAELQNMLFKLFGTKRLWLFMDLVKATEQPNAYLKEVLQEVAMQVKRGPDAGKWEVKAEYRT